MPSNPDTAAARIAARQRGLITLRQATIIAGMTMRQIEIRLRSGRWRKVQRGVYAVSGAQPSYLQSLLAAQLAARSEKVVVQRHKTYLEELDDAVVTGRSAVWIRGCRRLGEPKKHELLVNRLRAPSVNGATARRTRVLPAVDIETVDGVPTLAVPRLLVELCGQIPDLDFVAALDDLLSIGDATLRRDVHARAIQLRAGRQSVSRLVELTKPGAEAAFRSWLERHVAGLFTAAGLPPADWNLELRDDDGSLIGIGDAVWREQRVVVELDGLRFHSTPAQRRRDNRKDRRLSMTGWLVLRYTWLDLMERPEEVIAEVRAALASRASRAEAGG